MEFIEMKKDLFSVDESYALVHCISSDFALGKGIAVKFRDMGVKKALEKMYKPLWWSGFGSCLVVDVQDRIVFNLVTKEHYYDKPTYQTIRGALLELKVDARNEGVTKLAMPLIGCGLDKLEWSKVSEIIKEIFDDTDIEILICRL